jgi:hypothetical protein
MNKFAIAYIVFLALPVTAMAGSEQNTGHKAGASIDQSHPGSGMSVSENASAKHLAAAAAHEQTAMHHKAAANASPEQIKEHAIEAEKASIAACQKSKDAVKSSLNQ